MWNKESLPKESKNIYSAMCYFNNKIGTLNSTSLPNTFFVIILFQTEPVTKFYKENIVRFIVAGIKQITQIIEEI